MTNKKSSCIKRSCINSRRSFTSRKEEGNTLSSVDVVDADVVDADVVDADVVDADVVDVMVRSVVPSVVPSVPLL
jgi:hypothetical protein